MFSVLHTCASIRNRTDIMKENRDTKKKMTPNQYLKPEEIWTQD